MNTSCSDLCGGFSQNDDAGYVGQYKRIVWRNSAYSYILSFDTFESTALTASSADVFIQTFLANSATVHRDLPPIQLVTWNFARAMRRAFVDNLVFLHISISRSRPVQPSSSRTTRRPTDGESYQIQPHHLPGPLSSIHHSHHSNTSLHLTFTRGRLSSKRHWIRLSFSQNQTKLSSRCSCWSVGGVRHVVITASDTENTNLQSASQQFVCVRMDCLP